MYVHILDGFVRELDIMQQIYATRVTYYFLLLEIFTSIDNALYKLTYNLFSLYISIIITTSSIIRNHS